MDRSTESLELTLDKSAHPLLRVPASSLTLETFVEQYQRKGIPVVITGLLKPDLDWNLDYLCETLHSQAFFLRHYGSERYKQDKREWTSIGSGVQPQKMPFVEYAELLRNHKAHENDIYMAKCSIKDTLLADAQALQTINQELTQIGLTQPASNLNLWVGPGGHVEALHYDPTDGTLIQLHGSKRVVLFPPSQLSNLYPYPVHTHLRRGLKLRCWFSQVYPDRPDFAAFPKLRDALRHKSEIVLNRGEILYIPAGWWHEVTALGNEMVCSVNRFWQVYPTSRAVLSWSRWRTYLGSACALLPTLSSFVAASFRGESKQKLKEILQML